MSDQFEDAPNDTTVALEPQSGIIRPTKEVTYIQDSDLEWSDSNDEDENDQYGEDYDEREAYEDEKERAAENYGVDDEDWEIAEKGRNLFTLYPCISAIGGISF